MSDFIEQPDFSSQQQTFEPLALKKQATEQHTAGERTVNRQLVKRQAVKKQTVEKQTVEKQTVKKQIARKQIASKQTAKKQAPSRRVLNHQSEAAKTGATLSAPVGSPANASHMLNHIMIISSEIELAETLQMDLAAQGFQVSVIHDGLRGLLAIKRVAPDLVIVSWSPPRLSGVEICDRLRASKDEQPIILLTDGDSAQQRIAGLEAGASDCISFPFAKEEFIARVRASLTRYNSERAALSTLRCADIVLNKNTREVFRGENFIRLTAKEFDLLEYLMSHYFQVLTRAQILENVWGYDYTGSSNIVEVYIRYLRNKLNADGGRCLIQTVRSVGYILREKENEQ